MATSKSELLQGWKEIAAYVSRDERTVKRWEKQRGLPVRRMPGRGRANVYALAAELDAWLSSAPALAETEPFPEPDSGEDEIFATDPEPALDVDPALQTPSEAEPASLGTGSVAVAESAPEVVRSVAQPPPPVPRTRTGRRVSLRAVLVASGVILAVVVILVGVASSAWFRHRPAQPFGPYAQTGEPESAALRAPQPVRPSSVSGVDELYFRGVYFYEQRTPDSLNHAVECFTQAIALDPAYAPSYAGLANTYNLLREYSILPPGQVFAKAREAAQKAVSLDPNLSQGHAALGFADFFGFWKAADAEREFRAAIALDPNSGLAHAWYGSMLTHEARYPEALVQLDIAYRLQPSSAAIASSRALALGLGGHRNEGVDLLQEMISQNPSVSSAHLRLAILCLVQPRDIPRYLDSSRRAAEIRHNQEELDLVAVAEKAFRAGGEKPMWRAILAEMRRRSPNGVEWRMAEAEAALGNNDQALADISQLIQHHDADVVGIEMSPVIAHLHGDPRFQKLAAQIGLPPVR